MWRKKRVLCVACGTLFIHTQILFWFYTAISWDYFEDQSVFIIIEMARFSKCI